MRTPDSYSQVVLDTWQSIDRSESLLLSVREHSRQHEHLRELSERLIAASRCAIAEADASVGLPGE
jgi:hypothetical protein